VSADPGTFASWMDVLQTYGALGVMTLFAAYQTWNVEGMKKELTRARELYHELATRFAVQAESTRNTLEGTRVALERVIDKVLG